ncbi:hypothetical protein DBR40_19870 [Pedobacter sp. KBW01]|nr:hypothetical protein DBR40_19870 [Pedobacter sp. KBW01]
MKLFKTPWFYVGIMFLVITFTSTFARLFEHLDYYFAQAFNYKDDVRSNLISLIPWLVLPLAVTYFVSKYIIKCIVDKRLY